jgi:hypothetical protein
MHFAERQTPAGKLLVALPEAMRGRKALHEEQILPSVWQ